MIMSYEKSEAYACMVKDVIKKYPFNTTLLVVYTLSAFTLLD